MFRWTAPLRGPRVYSHAAVALGHKLYCFMGFGILDSFSQISVYVLNTVALRWVKLPPVVKPGERPPEEVPYMYVGHTAVLVEGVVYIWGEELYHGNQLYAFDVGAHRWSKTEVSGAAPEARSGHSACVLGKAMYVHGGRVAGHIGVGHCNNDTYKLDIAAMVWCVIYTGGAAPHASSHHSATVIGTRMFVFGGWGGPGVHYSDLRVFDTETDRWLSSPPPTAQFPPERCSHHAAFAYGGELYVFYVDETNLENSLWRFNTKTFAWKKVEPKGTCPSKTSGISHCCAVGDRVVLFGADLHVLDLSPSLRTLCKLAVIQRGLEQSGLPHDVRWELAATASGGNWHQVGTGMRCKLAQGENWKQVGGSSKWERAASGNWQRVGNGSFEIRWKA